MKHKKAFVRRLLSVLVAFVLMNSLFPSMASAEQTPWDCPECGRTGNTGNFCGGCGHPAPWTDNEASAPGYADSKSSWQYKAGDIVTFGRYEQDNLPSTDPEEIEWIVLDYDETNHKALLISRYGLDTKQFNAAYANVTWAICSLRAWLNEEFFQEAFSAEEQSAIMTTDVDNSSEQSYWGTSGENTLDRIFLLSCTEANRYFGVEYADGGKNIRSRVTPTKYAIANGAMASDVNRTEDGTDAVGWWLRTRAEYQRDAAFVDDDGSLNWYGVHNDTVVVRPVLWIDLESGII